MTLDIAKQVAVLTQMTVRELREKYETVFGKPTRAGNKDFPFKRIAGRIQSVAEGDLSERARRQADALARDADIRTTPRPPKVSPDRDRASSPPPARCLHLGLPSLFLRRYRPARNAFHGVACIVSVVAWP